MSWPEYLPGWRPASSSLTFQYGSNRHCTVCLCVTETGGARVARRVKSVREWCARWWWQIVRALALLSLTSTENWWGTAVLRRDWWRRSGSCSTEAGRVKYLNKMGEITNCFFFSALSETLYNSNGRDLRRALFSLKQIFQVIHTHTMWMQLPSVCHCTTHSFFFSVCNNPSKLATPEKHSSNLVHVTKSVLVIII